MELKVYRDAVTAMGVLSDAKMEIPLETEILIPDYMPAVFKIVKTFVHRVVLQKQLQAGHVLIEGYFRIEVLYQSEEQKLCMAEQKVAFSKQQDVRGSEDSVQPGEYQIDISGEVQYINCRAVSSRRLDVRGAYNLSVHAMCIFRHQVITALSENGIQQKNVTVPAVQVYSSREKQFTLEEPIQFEQPPEAILHTKAFAQLQDVHVLAGKAVAKGELKVELIYRQSDSPQLCRQESVLPFNQVVEMEAGDETYECQAFVEPVGCAVFAESGESGETKISCACMLTVRAMKSVDFISVADCFSTTMQTRVEYGELTTNTLVELLSNTIEARVDGKLPDDSLQVMACFVECAVPEIVPDNAQTAIRGRAIAHLICSNTLGEIDCYDKTCEYLLPKRYDVRPEELVSSLHAVCDGVKFGQTGVEAFAELSIRVQGYLCKRQSSLLVQDVECTQPLEKDEDIALRVYYAAAGEEVFDIAKRYNASPATISALADIQGNCLQQAARLLIPQSL